MAEEVTQEQSTSLADNLTPEEQKALDKVRGNTKDYVEDNFNEDGTPKSDFEIPEKFKGKSTEEIVKAYLELEKMKSKQGDTSKKPEDSSEETNGLSEMSDKGDEEKDPEEPSKDSEETPKITTETFTKYEQAFLEKGQLEEEHYKELEGLGFSKDMVDAYIEGQKARGQLYASQIYSVVGSEEAYNELVAWGRENLSDVAKKDFDEKIKSNNIELAKLAIETLQAQRGLPPRRVEGTAGADTGGLKPFSDKGDWMKAVRNPMYGKDRRYTELVDKRYILSKQKNKL